MVWLDRHETTNTTRRKETVTMDNLIPPVVADFLRWLIDLLED